MKNKMLKAVILLPICLLTAAPSYGATITYENIAAEGGYTAPVLIEGLDLGGIFWDVTINWNTSYNTTYTSAPMFFGNPQGAQNATTAIQQALLNDTPAYPGTGLGSSYLMTPYSQTASYGVWGTDMHVGSVALFPDALYTRSGFTTWSVSAVPVPSAVWLFGSGLIGLIGIARKKKS